MNRMVISGLSAALFLTACGGGGGSSSDGGGQPQSGDPFSVTTLTSNACGLESPLAEARVLFHADSGDIINTQRTGADGVLNTRWPESARHVSVVGIDASGDLPEIRTWIDWNSGDLGRVSFGNFDIAGCDCGSLILDTTDVLAIYPGYSLYSGTTKYDELNGESYCVAEGEKLILDLLLRSDNGFQPYAAGLTLMPPLSDSFKLSPEQFSGEENEGVAIEVRTEHSYDFGYSFAETTLGRQHFYLQSNLFDTAYYFPGLSEHNLFQALNRLSLGSTEMGQIEYSQARRGAIEAGAVNIELPDTQQAYVEEAMRVLNGMVENSGSAGYDFSNVANGANQLVVELYDMESSLSWSVFAPVKGDIPDLDLPSDLIREFDRVSRPGMSMLLYGYNQPLSLDEFRRQVILETVDEGERSRFFDDYVYQNLSIRAN